MLVGCPESDWGKLPPCPARRGWSGVSPTGSVCMAVKEAGQKVVFTWWRRDSQQQRAVNCCLDVCPKLAQQPENQGWDSPNTPIRRSKQGDTDELTKDGDDDPCGRSILGWRLASWQSARPDVVRLRDRNAVIRPWPWAGACRP